MTDEFAWGAEDPTAVSIEDREALRKRVLNVIGHELRTPVSTLCGLADALVATEDKQERAELSVAVGRTARRIEGLLDDLLTAGGITTALPTTPTAPVRVADLVDDLIDGADVRGDRDALALVQEAALRRAMGQVLDNALKYGEQTDVHIRADAEVVEIAIDSLGAPVLDEELRLATAAFYRGERAVTTAPGLGIGLAVAKALVEHQQGHLRLEPLEGGGVRTVIVVPAAQTRSSPDSSSPKGGSRRSPDSSSPKGGSRRSPDSSSPKGGSRRS